MAIFYEHIKGCGPDNKYISWIRWSNESDVPSNFDYKYLPTIKVGKKNFGNIITSAATGQSINKAFRFNEQVAFARNILLEWDQNYYYTVSTGSQGEFYFDDARQIQITTTQESDNFIKFNTSLFETQTIKATTSITTPEGNITTLKGTTINISGKCQANYFNATSDARAKSNITPAQFSALDVIKQLPIYTFNYLTDPNLSVGLIAQEAAEYDLDGFNMVDNLDAEGAFGDFMQIKESKLVYVLWKAVQELTDEINSLKTQIQRLENK